MKRIGAIALSVAVVSTPALAGPDWIEQADAGPTYGSAQRIVGIGVPHSISGTLSAGLVDPAYLCRHLRLCCRDNAYPRYADGQLSQGVREGFRRS